LRDVALDEHDRGAMLCTEFGSQVGLLFVLEVTENERHPLGCQPFRYPPADAA
jgi:hypothetical protein